jgi:hypothetical protein
VRDWQAGRGSHTALAGSKQAPASRLCCPAKLLTHQVAKAASSSLLAPAAGSRLQQLQQQRGSTGLQAKAARSQCEEHWQSACKRRQCGRHVAAGFQPSSRPKGQWHGAGLQYNNHRLRYNNKRPQKSRSR